MQRYSPPHVGKNKKASPLARMVGLGMVLGVLASLGASFYHIWVAPLDPDFFAKLGKSWGVILVGLVVVFFASALMSDSAPEDSDDNTDKH